MGAIATIKAQARMTGEDRRRQIVDISAELFSRKGFNGTTTKEIADRAGVSEAIIFRHFPNKRALYSAIIDYKTRQTSELMQERLKEAASRKDDRAFFLTLALEMLNAHTSNPMLMRLLMFSALEGHELAEMFFQSTAQEVRNSVLRYIKQRVSDRAFRAVDPKVCSRAFVGMILFHAQVRVIYKNTSCDDIKLSNKQMAERFVDIFLEGIRRDGAKQSR
jgi:AcrR family transcriptional regulator